MKMDGCSLMKCKYWDGKICSSEHEICLYQTNDENFYDTLLEAAQAKRIERLQNDLDKSKGYPIQDGENIPEWLAKIVYRVYNNKYQNGQSYERIKERGGFGKAEFLWLLSILDIRTILEAEKVLKGNE